MASKAEVTFTDFGKTTDMAAKQEQEVNFFELASAKITEAQKLMAEARDLLKKDLYNAR